MKPPVLNKRTRQLLNAFERAARSWEWESDQGSADQAAKARARYTRAKLALEQHLAGIELLVARTAELEDVLRAIHSAAPGSEMFHARERVKSVLGFK